jgi:hypothetical protein
MATVGKAVAALASDLKLFSSEIETQIRELNQNLEYRPITGATHYRHCLEDLCERCEALAGEVKALEETTMDVLSFDELTRLCSSLYSNNLATAAALETHLKSYGYNQIYHPMPPKDPLSSLKIKSSSISPTNNNKNTTTTPAPPSTVCKAMAPLTAAEALIARKEDTPSSLESSPAILSPSMQALMGKYANMSGGSSITPEGLLLHSSPLPQQVAAAAAVLNAHNTNDNNGVIPPTYSHHQLATAATATTPNKGQLSPGFQAAANAQAAALVNKYNTNTMMDRLYISGQEYEIDEETTLELKSQVIKSRGLIGHGKDASFSFQHNNNNSGQVVNDAVLSHHQQQHTTAPPAPAAIQIQSHRLDSIAIGPPSNAQNKDTATTLTPSYNPVLKEEYESLPIFIKSQIPLDILNSTLKRVYTGLVERGGDACFGWDDIEKAGLASSKGKVFVNSLVKLQRAQLRVVLGHGTKYYLS